MDTFDPNALFKNQLSRKGTVKPPESRQIAFAGLSGRLSGSVPVIHPSSTEARISRDSSMRSLTGRSKGHRSSH